jgi:hypothetical protein
MPHHIPDFQVSHFLTSNTVPIHLASLPTSCPTERECPICHNAYVDPPGDYVHPDVGDNEVDYAVQVQNRGTCEHVFGRRCIKAHIRGGNPWSHTCPLCRAEWFPAPSGGRGQVLGQVEVALTRLARLEAEVEADETSRRQFAEVDAALRRIREILDGRRWI